MSSEDNLCDLHGRHLAAAQAVLTRSLRRLAQLPRRDAVRRAGETWGRITQRLLVAARGLELSRLLWHQTGQVLQRFKYAWRTQEQRRGDIEEYGRTKVRGRMVVRDRPPPGYRAEDGTGRSFAHRQRDADVDARGDGRFLLRPEAKLKTRRRPRSKRASGFTDGASGWQTAEGVVASVDPRRRGAPSADESWKFVERLESKRR